MKKKNLFAFSLAEMLVVILIICIAIAVFAPIITRRISNNGSSDDVNTKTDYVVSAGTIAIWPSDQDPPTGWRLCNGQNGTPDLQGYFIKGAENPSVYGSSTIQASANKRHCHGLYSTSGYYSENDNYVVGLANDSNVGILGNVNFTEHATGTWDWYFKDGKYNRIMSSGVNFDSNRNKYDTDKDEFRPKNIALNYIIKQ